MVIRKFKSLLSSRIRRLFAEWSIARATASAHSHLRSSPITGVLVDVTVLQHAVTHETGWISTGPAAWGTDVIDTGYMARIPVYKNESKSKNYRNIKYLVGICHLFRSGVLRLFTSSELNEEMLWQPIGRFGGYGYFDFYLFDGLRMESIDGRVSLSMISSIHSIYSPKDHQRARIREYRSAFPDFDELVRVLGEANSQDAWHLFTANRFGLFCYLTMDYKFIKTVQSQSGSAAIKRLVTKVLTPEEFGRAIHLRPLSPNIMLSFNSVYFDRSDLNMPGERRRPKNCYSKKR